MLGWGGRWWSSIIWLHVSYSSVWHFMLRLGLMVWESEGGELLERMNQRTRKKDQYINIVFINR